MHVKRESLPSIKKDRGRFFMFRIPKHIGIIPDGNRRWAKEKGLKKEDGYAYGLNPGVKVVQLAKKYGVEELTYYGFTVDNCKRPKEQVKAFSKACVDAVNRIKGEDVSVRVLGNTKSSCFPEELLAYTEEREPKEADMKKMKVNLLVNYGWEWDMKNNWASRNIPRVDMIIRWGGMCRLSGFLPIQSVYSDFYIVKELWPDFSEAQFENALKWYQKQDVTLGG